MNETANAIVNAMRKLNEMKEVERSWIETELHLDGTMRMWSKVKVKFPNVKNPQVYEIESPDAVGAFAKLYDVISEKSKQKIILPDKKIIT